VLDMQKATLQQELQGSLFFNFVKCGVALA
jgi:hypothetical protein